jgi:hypothetical protein
MNHDECCPSTKSGSCLTMKNVLLLALGVAAVLVVWKMTPSMIRYSRMSRM